MPQDCERKVGSKHFVEGIPNDVTFVDGFPFLVTSEASLRELNKLLPQPVRAPAGGGRVVGQPHIGLQGMRGVPAQKDWGRGVARDTCCIQPM